MKDKLNKCEENKTNIWEVEEKGEAEEGREKWANEK